MAHSMQMTVAEWRISLGLASIFGLRMFGMFMIFPVFALNVRYLAGGSDLAMAGLAMGIYGLTQAICQIPLGWASDRWGRKPIIYLGLVIFILGCVVAAFATNIIQLIVGRAIQGGGAISAVVMALTADLTRPIVRTKAMAIIGATIGLSFGLSLVLSPILVPWFGLSGLFGLTGVLALLALLVVRHIPTPSQQTADRKVIPQQLSAILRDRGLFQLNCGIFALHLSLGALFVEFPNLLVRHGISSEHHWLVYLTTVFPSFFLVYPWLKYNDQSASPTRLIFGAFVLLLLGIGIVSVLPSATWLLLAGFLLFFLGFNYLEASLPARISKLALPNSRGTAISLFSMAQFLGSFLGPTLGGWFLKLAGNGAATRFAAAAVLSWLLINWRISILREKENGIH